MTTFEEARAIAEDLNAGAWRDLGNRGEYMVAAWGYEDDEHWQVVEGARELIEGGDYDFSVLDQPLTLVAKADGSIMVGTYLELEDKLDAMTPVGPVPDAE